MEKKVEQFFQSAQSISLSSREKAALLKSIVGSGKKRAPTASHDSPADADVTAFFAKAQAICLDDAERASILAALRVAAPAAEAAEEAVPAALRAASGIALREGEKDEMFDTLQSFMRSHPVPARGSARGESLLEGFLRALHGMRFAPPLAVGVFTLLFGGASFAAEGALPGDFLYPLKIHVTEPARGAVALSAEGKARWDLRVATRRLEEAASLAASQQLAPDVRDELLRRFADSARATREDIEQLRERADHETADAVRAEFDAAVAARAETLLGTPSDDHEQLQVRLQEILGDASAAASAAASLPPASRSAASAADPAAQVRADAEARVREAIERVAQVRAEIAARDPKSVARALTLLSAADGALTEAQSRMTEGNNVQAVSLAQSAADLAIEARAMADAEARLSAGAASGGNSSSLDARDGADAEASVEEAASAVADVRSYIAAQAVNLPPQSLARVTGLLQDAESRLISARSRLQAKLYLEARADALAAISLAGDARLAVQEVLRAGLGYRAGQSSSLPAPEESSSVTPKDESVASPLPVAPPAISSLPVEAPGI